MRSVRLLSVAPALAALSLAQAADPPGAGQVAQALRSQLSPEQARAAPENSSLEALVRPMNAAQRLAARTALARLETAAPSKGSLEDLHAAYLLLGSHQEALRLAQALERAAPNDASAVTRTAVTLFDAGDYAGAARRAREALALKPNDPNAMAVLRLAEDQVRGSLALPAAGGRGGGAPEVSASPGGRGGGSGPIKPQQRLTSSRPPPPAGAATPQAPSKSKEPWLTANGVKKALAAGAVIVVVAGLVYFAWPVLVGAAAFGGSGGGLALAGGGTLAAAETITAAQAAAAAAAVTGTMVVAMSATGNSPGGGSTGSGGGGGGGNHKYSGKSVADILKGKKGSIKNAPLEKGSPSWSDIIRMTWEDIEAGVRAQKPGFKTIRKLLTDTRFDR